MSNHRARLVDNEFDEFGKPNCVELVGSRGVGNVGVAVAMTPKLRTSVKCPYDGGYCDILSALHVTFCVMCPRYRDVPIVDGS